MYINESKSEKNKGHERCVSPNQTTGFNRKHYWPIETKVHIPSQHILFAMQYKFILLHFVFDYLRSVL